MKYFYIAIIITLLIINNLLINTNRDIIKRNNELANSNIVVWQEYSDGPTIKWNNNNFIIKAYYDELRSDLIEKYKDYEGLKESYSRLIDAIKYKDFESGICKLLENETIQCINLPRVNITGITGNTISIEPKNKNQVLCWDGKRNWVTAPNKDCQAYNVDIK